MHVQHDFFEGTATHIIQRQTLNGLRAAAGPGRAGMLYVLLYMLCIYQFIYYI